MFQVIKATHGQIQVKIREGKIKNVQMRNMYAIQPKATPKHNTVLSQMNMRQLKREITLSGQANSKRRWNKTPVKSGDDCRKTGMPDAPPPAEAPRHPRTMNGTGGSALLPRGGNY